MECPWDREQDERSIVPHTVEEAYELAAAAHSGDDASSCDELGDVLFQVHFLALLLEERGAGSLAEVAEHVHAKLVRRHPHIFGGGRGRRRPATVLRNWDAIKSTEEGREPGIFGEVPENLPGAAVRAQGAAPRRLVGLRLRARPVRGASRASSRSCEAAGSREEAFHEVGDVLFAAVNVARKLKVDPELALRAAADRFRGRVQGAADLAASEGADWDDLGSDEQLAYYARARLNEETSP